MKKILFVILCCLCLCGCGNKNTMDYKSLLIGEWSYLKTESGETQYSYFIFNKDNTFEYSDCFHRLSDDYCAMGEANWNGTYSIKNNQITLKITNEEQVISRYSNSITEPPHNLVVDFNNMYLCDSNQGLDCEKPFDKDTNG